MVTIKKDLMRFCGREFTPKEFDLIREIVGDYPNLSRAELANTISELLEWKRPGGGLKDIECRQFLEKLEEHGVLTLPEKKNTRQKNKPKKTRAPAKIEESWRTLTGKVNDFAPLDIELVQTPDQRRLFQDLIQQYHYLGYAMPFGARLQYLAYVTRPDRQLVGCIQFSSPAWRMKARDQWIGWDDETRGERLQHIVNNSRFLVLAKIENLASMLMARALKQLRLDWPRHYGLEPWLVETLVDKHRLLLNILTR